MLKAKRELMGIISDITSEMEMIFRREFAAIDAAFRKTFLELFGGGKAALMLEDEENVLDCGIEIRVQPPGKAVSAISLLSGGEKAFVAIALYFAILKVRPTPFCVMDEIEAALDEAASWTRLRPRWTRPTSPGLRAICETSPRARSFWSSRTAAARWRRRTTSSASPCRKRASAASSA